MLSILPVVTIEEEEVLQCGSRHMFVHTADHVSKTTLACGLSDRLSDASSMHFSAPHTWTYSCALVIEVEFPSLCIWAGRLAGKKTIQILNSPHSALLSSLF